MAKPNAPTALTASVASYNRINLSWHDNSTNETGFKIERKDTGSYALIATLGANTASYSNTGCHSKTTYTYRVYAYNAQGTSSFSNTAVGTTPAAPFSFVTVSPTSANVPQNTVLHITAAAKDVEGNVMTGSAFAFSIMPISTVDTGSMSGSAGATDSTITPTSATTVDFNAGMVLGSALVFCATGSSSGSCFATVVA